MRYRTDLDDIHDLQIDRKHRELYMVGEPDAYVEDDSEPGVEHILASRIIRNLRVLTNESLDSILIHMKTCGGHTTEGFAIYDAIRYCPCHITILSYSHARSMSSIILQAADYRVLMPSSYFMFHYGSLSVTGEAKAVKSSIAFDARYDRLMLDIYAERMKRRGKFETWSSKRIREMLVAEMNKRGDAFLVAEEARAWGLADSVFDGNWAKLK